MDKTVTFKVKVEAYLSKSKLVVSSLDANKDKIKEESEFQAIKSKLLAKLAQAKGLEDF